MIYKLLKILLSLNMLLPGYIDNTVKAPKEEQHECNKIYQAVFSLDKTEKQMCEFYGSDGERIIISMTSIESGRSGMHGKSVSEGAHFIEYYSYLISMSFIIAVLNEEIVDGYGGSFSSAYYEYQSSTLQVLSSKLARYSVRHRRGVTVYLSKLSAEITSSGTLNVTFQF